jgi:hypothetical protein
MSTGQGIIDNHSNIGQIAQLNRGMGGWLTSLLGCRHKEMSRPFSSQGQTYRTCLECGARRQFHVGRWEMQGGFYYGVPTPRLSERFPFKSDCVDFAVARKVELQINQGRCQDSLL